MSTPDEPAAHRGDAVATAPPAEAAPRGLSAAQVAERIAAGHVNEVPPRDSRSVADIVRANVLTRFNAIIGALFVVIVVVGPLQDALFGFVIVINTGIGIVQEVRAKRTLDRLSVIGAARPRVRRDGVEQAVESAEIVRDDLVLLAPGETVPVDGEVVEADGLEVDESLLTGESDPVVKRPGDRVLSGSFAVAGSGSYHAHGVGADSYAARLTAEAGRFTLVRSELRSGINQLLGYVAWAIIPVSAALIYSQIRSHDNTADTVRATVGGLVPMVPEGLVLLTSIAFALGVIRLGRRNCLVQELPAIEGLARVDTVCLDKTGTLTEEGMRLAEVRILDPGLPGREALGALVGTDLRPNASMAAIAAQQPVPPEWSARHVVPFSSARKWSGAAFADRGSWVLGAPDVLLPDDAPARREADGLAAAGLRVLLLARARQDLTDTDDDGPAGGPRTPGPVDAAALVVLEQRIRSDAEATLAYFARQGVAVKIISGDSATAVGAVAARLGLPGADDPVDARDLPEDGEELAEAVERHSVFGRVTPRQKKAMVTGLRSRGHAVAMTGDGVNDVLALKEADIGVAMGSGSGASRAVAQVVLLDNRFATLPDVVAEGRRVIGNIERVARLFLTKTAYSILLAVLVAACTLPFPFLPRHTTLIGTVTIGVPAFFLALAPNRTRARPGFVRRTLRFAIPAGVIAGLGTFVSYLLARLDHASPLAADQTTATFTLTLIGLYVLAIVARPYRWWKLLLLAAVTVASALAFVVRPIASFLALSAHHKIDLVTGAGTALTCAFLLEIALVGVSGPLWVRSSTPDDADLGVRSGSGEAR